MSTGEFRGRQAIAARLRSQLAAFPDRTLREVALFELGDTVIAEYEFSGTHEGSLALPDGRELPATGQHLTFPVVSIFEYRDGRCVQHRLYADLLPPMIQIGAVAATAPT